jgi:hypothetical protein
MHRFIKICKILSEKGWNKTLWARALAHICNLSYLGGGDRGSKTALVKSSQDLFSKTKPGMVTCTCNPSYVGGRGNRIMIQGQPWAESVGPYLKNN